MKTIQIAIDPELLHLFEDKCQIISSLNQLL